MLNMIFNTPCAVYINLTLHSIRRIGGSHNKKKIRFFVNREKKIGDLAKIKVPDIN